MRLILIILMLGMAAGLYVFMEDGKQQDLEIATLRTQIEWLQLSSASRAPVLVYDATKVSWDKAIKY
ncbi:MAG: hypothetical protein KKF12_12135 [Proteobacteria bacterium]|nr:hypothetical protein [Desulfobacula sp.]MBU3953970.1 hypothetical protein [Pseudomonadota bacterium]MBU4131561.1 hypothetical protein [Pseudomonadota bacterium]